MPKALQRIVSLRFRLLVDGRCVKIAVYGGIGTPTSPQLGLKSQLSQRRAKAPAGVWWLFCSLYVSCRRDGMLRPEPQEYLVPSREVPRSLVFDGWFNFGENKVGTPLQQSLWNRRNPTSFFSHHRHLTFVGGYLFICFGLRRDK